MAWTWAQRILAEMSLFQRNPEKDTGEAFLVDFSQLPPYDRVSRKVQVLHLGGWQVCSARGEAAKEDHGTPAQFAKQTDFSVC